MIDLSRPAQPRLLQTVNLGPNLSGVSVSDDGRHVLTVSAGDAAVHLLAVEGDRLAPLQRIVFGADDKAIDVDIAPDGRTVLVALQNRGLLKRFALRGGRLQPDGELEVGVQPYGVTVDRRGRYAYVSLLGGARPAAGAPPRTGRRIGGVAVVDLTAWRLLTVAEAGVTPEHLTLSPDGRHLAVVLINGSNGEPGATSYRDHGFLKVFRIEAAGGLSPIAEARTGAWCQGATWSGDSRRIFLQCTVDRTIDVFAFDGRTLAPLPRETLRFDTRPGAITTAQTR